MLISKNSEELLRTARKAHHNFPALLIISECCLFLTFLLHVIVPEFRRQIFGKDIFQMCYAIASPLSRMDEDVYGGESLSRLPVVHHNILW